MSLHLQIEKRLEPVEVGEGNTYQESGEAKSGCTIFLGYTSNLISSGVRESIRYLAEHKMVDSELSLVRNTKFTAWFYRIFVANLC